MSVRTPGAFRPYAQVLFGFSTLFQRTVIAGIEDDDNTTAFMIQPGGGVTMVVGDGWGLFADVAYRRSFFDTGSNEVRVLVGARMILD